MTHEQYGNLAHSSAINEPNQVPDDNQYVPVETTTTMSSHGPLENEYTSDYRLSGGWIVQNDKMQAVAAGEVSTAEGTTSTSSIPMQSPIDQSVNFEQRPTKRARVHFYEFASQARLQQHHERRKQSLIARRRVLQKSLALSARLRRTSSWVQDGLVEISKHQDPKAFAQVFSHTQDLVDNCYSHWNNELNNLDIVQSSGADSLDAARQASFFDRLPDYARTDLLELLSNLRSNPRFMIERLRILPTSQVATLTSSPKWQFSDAILSFSQDSARSGSQRRRQLQAYSKELEEYATSFERTSPLSLLLHNLYSHDVTPESPESQLRLHNWSTICAELLRSGSNAYSSLYWQLLESFSILQDWPAKTRIELFMMDTLQKGAFLINDSPMQKGKPGFNPLNTEAARTFFDEAVQELYWTLIDCRSGCYPPGALSLAHAILGKLASEDLQMRFRSHFFAEWYLGHFLKTAIMFPENENMLLKMHVSKKARDHILAPIYNRFLLKYKNHQQPVTDQDVSIRNIIEDMLGMLEGSMTVNPYTVAAGPESSHSIQENDCLQTVVITASEIVQLLETLSPQTIHSAQSSDPIMRESGRAFHLQHSNPRTKFDLLKQQIQHLIDPGTSAKDTHPCLEAWADLGISTTGAVVALQAYQSVASLASFVPENSADLSQQAALRLCTESFTENDENLAMTKWSQSTTLGELFLQRIEQSQAQTRTVDLLYWKKALEHLENFHRRYTLTSGTGEDSIILASLTKALLVSCESSTKDCAVLENQLGMFEIVYKGLRNTVKKFMAGLEELRLKLWYTSQVIQSDVYTNARNIASALSHMAIPTMQVTTKLNRAQAEQTRPSTSWSSRSSNFGEPQDDTMKLLKAPTEHGGPRKLADEQIERINTWIKQNSIDIFCTGEERLHRFCMEIQLVTKRLTGESMNESPELWSSDLFDRERYSFDVQTLNINSAPASTRPGSIYSDSYSTNYPPARPLMRSTDSDVRSIVSDDRSSARRGSVLNLFQKSLYPTDLASSLGSYGRTSSANTTASDIFSSASQSVTSYSVYSRAPSILSGRLPNYGPRAVPSTKEKRKFREQLRKGLVCLLLSDLGSLVWSWGCETDKWVGDNQASDTVQTRLQRRLAANALRSQDVPSAQHGRRRSMTEIPQTVTQIENTEQEVETDTTVQQTYLMALGDVLFRLSKQVDPVGKLGACVDFHELAVQQMGSEKAHHQTKNADYGARRRSLDQKGEDVHEAALTGLAKLSLSTNTKRSETRVIDHIKRQLAMLGPTTIFRDLQFIAVFAPPELLDRKAAGEAFMNLGMAAIQYKNELCASMVDIADQIAAADATEGGLTPGAGQPLSKAAEYWRIGALEGNAVAQRELASLYLVHPEMLSVVTTPLSTSSDIFRDDMMWETRTKNDDSRQALCLALHWMQQAAHNGDAIAKRKLEERKEASIR